MPDELTRERVAVASLTPHPQNYRTHPADQLAHIGQSLREHGQYRNIVVARGDVILAGHGVVEAAAMIGMDEVDVIRLDLDPDEPRAIKLLAGDNEISRLAEIDDRLLSEHLKTLAGIGELLGTGYDEMMLANLAFVTRMEGEIATMDHAAEWAAAGMPEFNEFDDPYKVVVSFTSPAERERFLGVIGVEVINRRDRETWSVRWPPREKEDLSSLRFDPVPAEAVAE